MEIVIGVFGFGLAANTAMFLYALFFSRVTFDRYVRKQYPALYSRLMARAMPGFTPTSDRTDEMRVFRTESSEYKDDERLEFLRHRSRALFRQAIFMWFALGAMLILAAAYSWLQKGAR